MPPRRTFETGLAAFTLVLLAFYIPLETLFHWPTGLLDPYYLVDVVAMVLLLWGALHSLRARPRASPALLCVGYAWTSANGWRATSDRLTVLEAGGSMTHGAKELWAVWLGTGLCLAILVALLVLVVLDQRSQNAP